MQGVLVEDEHHSCGPTIEEKKNRFQGNQFYLFVVLFL